MTIIFSRVWFVAALILLSLFLVRPGAGNYSKVLHVTLPIAGLGCAVATGNAGGYFARYVSMWVTIKATKRGLGEAEINRRPDGRYRGFPSTHTASAVFGASGLVQTCLREAPIVKTAVVVAAAFTGASRIETEHHTTWQVLAGTIWALAFERGLRRGSRGRRKFEKYWGQSRPWRLSAMTATRTWAKKRLFRPFETDQIK